MSRRKSDENVPEKANRILNSVLIVLVLIVIKVWHLSVVQHDDKIEASKKPQRKTVIERADRATIADRFGIPMALNKVQYNACIDYSAVKEIPRVEWVKDASGKKTKWLRRKEYITALASLLGHELDMDCERIEDLIHSKASLFGSVPFVLKENISESEYFRLQMLLKDWPGIRPEVVARRTYPLGPIGCEVVGYMGAISKQEYEAITAEMKLLREAVTLHEQEEVLELPEGYSTIEEVKSRLADIESRAYTINDYIGKAGVEGSFDEALRGKRGKKTFVMDVYGHVIEQLPDSKDPQPGHRLYLSISSQLQAYAESLLTEFEQEPPSERPAALLRRAQIPEKQPWIKGGAIVALDPNTGEVLALASYPRFNPQDFIRGGDEETNREKAIRINRWLESENYLSLLWDQKIPLQRERFDPNSGRYFQEEDLLSWNNYLQMILPASSAIRVFFNKSGTLENAACVQQKIKKLEAFFADGEVHLSAAKLLDLIYTGEAAKPIGVTITLPEKHFFEERSLNLLEEIESIKEELKPFFAHLPLNYEKLLLVDLCRIAVNEDRFTPRLLELLGTQTLSEYRDVSAKYSIVQEGLKDILKAIFHENDFRTWREEHSKTYLAEKRKEEAKARRKYARPYLEYIDEAETEQFKAFWEQNKEELLAFFLEGSLDATLLSNEKMHPYIIALKGWQEELWSDKAPPLPWVSHYELLRERLGVLDPSLLRPYLRTLRSFEDLNRPLLGTYRGIRSLGGRQLEKHLAAAFYPAYGYGYARSQAFRQAAIIGSIFKLIPAYEALKQRYTTLQEEGKPLRDLNPLIIIDDKHKTFKEKTGGWNVGYTDEGKPIPLFYHGGRLPRSDHAGLGKLDLVRALEVSSNPYFAMLAGDILEDPEDLCKAAELFGFGEKTGIDLPGEFAGLLPDDVTYNRTGLYSMAIGQHTLVGTPLQTALMLSALANGGKVLKPKIVVQEKVGNQLKAIPTEIRWRIFLPASIRTLLLTGMRQCIWGDKGTARSLKSQFPHSLLSTIVGKTSTAEVVERMSLDGTVAGVKSKVIWFGAIGFDEKASSEFASPKVVVVVYIRTAEYGWEAAPLAVKMIEKWYEISGKSPEKKL